MNNNSVKRILSLDAGASTIRAVIFNDKGETINSRVSSEGANATIDPEESSKRIMNVIGELLDNTKLSFDDISQ